MVQYDAVFVFQSVSYDSGWKGCFLLPNCTLWVKGKKVILLKKIDMLLFFKAHNLFIINNNSKETSTEQFHILEKRTVFIFLLTQVSEGVYSCLHPPTMGRTMGLYYNPHHLWEEETPALYCFACTWCLLLLVFLSF